MSVYGINISQWANPLGPFLQTLIIPPASTKLKGGYTGFTLSVCPSVDRIVSALYLQQYSSDPFHICTSYQATSEGVSRVMFISKFKNLNFCNFDFVFFRLGIQYDSIEWTIMRRQGVSSERRRSSRSSLLLVSWAFATEIALICVLMERIDDKSTLIQVMAWGHQATSHCQN